MGTKKTKLKSIEAQSNLHLEGVQVARCERVSSGY